MIFNSPLDALWMPRLYKPSPQQNPNLVAISFEFMKRIPARHCIERALDPTENFTLDESGFFSESATSVEIGAVATLSQDHEHRIFIETSSGNMATGLAEVSAAMNLELHLLVPATVDDSTKQAIRASGVRLEEIDAESQDARVERLVQIDEDYRSKGWAVSWVNQYGNPDNPNSYWRLAELLVSEFDVIDVLVAPVGTGGSSGGTTRFLRDSGFPELELVGVDACGSTNFGHGPSPYLLGGLGSDRFMPLLDPTLYDVVHWVDDNTAFKAVSDLYKKNVKVGGSSGAAFVAASWEAKLHPDRIVVVIFPDTALRYLGSLLSEEWRDRNGVDFGCAQTSPLEIQSSRSSDPSLPGVEAGWFRMEWGRRAIASSF
ncbi:cysteine synthase A [Arthrobacter sp. 1088]|uniref:pyridoxal-phosphate dependent enzyme n=1 Tax=Arthrobacter sp. 1088 TaxID=2817768 RepID=UPI002861678A|nr:pyridoxal-phosphate dependent enzyme [Arthrobacter sp. 1088]MDR6687897.1 cysteine synthase A [Arthrobacter sp. 1088]